MTKNDRGAGHLNWVIREYLNEVTVFEVRTAWVEEANYVKLWGQAFSRQKVEQAEKN